MTLALFLIPLLSRSVTASHTVGSYFLSCDLNW